MDLRINVPMQLCIHVLIYLRIYVYVYVFASVGLYVHVHVDASATCRHKTKKSMCVRIYGTGMCANRLTQPELDQIICWTLLFLEPNVQ